MFRAAFKSRSITDSQLSQMNVLSDSVRLGFRHPQFEQVLLDGNQRSTIASLDPYQRVL